MSTIETPVQSSQETIDQQAPAARAMPSTDHLLRKYKEVTLIIWTNGKITSKFECFPRKKFPLAPIVHRELRQLNRALMVGFRRQLHKYKLNTALENQNISEIPVQEPNNEPE